MGQTFTSPEWDDRWDMLGHLSDLARRYIEELEDEVSGLNSQVEQEFGVSSDPDYEAPESEAFGRALKVGG